MISNSVTVLAGATAALLLCCAAPAKADTTVYARLIEQNNSGGAGTVTLTATDTGELKVSIHATGLMPGPHAQHLHGSLQGGEFMCASDRSDADGDGWVTNEEASGEYGSAFLALTTRGDTSAKSVLNLERMPVADPEGRLTYNRVIPAAQVPDGLIDQLSHLHVVQHGIDVNDNGRYDLAALGESTFAKGIGLAGVPEEATNPATCGMITGAGAGHKPHGGVDTGAGPTDGIESLPLAALGVGLLGLAVGVQRRRRRRQQSRFSGSGKKADDSAYLG
jgi:hypothetical protein